jgi:IS1 family transposase/transposase-like protein
VPVRAFESLLVLGLTLVFLGFLVEVGRFDNCAAAPETFRRRPRPLRPRSPDDCRHCRDAAVAQPAPIVRTVVPYAQRKSPRGRKKTINSRGQACPNPDCDYYRITEAAIHALVGYGHHGQRDFIQDFYCQACHHKFSARRYTALYRLKTPQARVAQVLHAVAEGLSAHAAARVFQLSETTVRSWVARAGQHSQQLHHRSLRALHLTHVQFDELRLRLCGAAEATWLWVACDASTKLIPAFTLGPRTQAMAHQLVHEVARRLAPSCLPVFSSDGLALYFYALTAHFGEWVQTEGERHPTWVASAQLLYAQVVKRYRRRRITEVRHQVLLGKPEDYRQTLGIHGFSGRIQTAYIERLNLTIRRSIAGLARRSWSAAHSLAELTLQFEWWRAVYHFARPHQSLRQPLGTTPAQPTRQRFRPRTPAQAAGLTSRRWTILEVLSYPAPPLTSR